MLAFSVSAAEQKLEKIEVLFLDENGEEVSVTKEMADSFIKQLNINKEINIRNSSKIISRASCTHIPCNQVETTLYSHTKVSTTECRVYTKRAIVCQCCGAILKSLSSEWQFAYSHTPHF